MVRAGLSSDRVTLQHETMAERPMEFHKHEPITLTFGDDGTQRRFLEGVVPGDRESRVVAEMRKMMLDLRPVGAQALDLRPTAKPVPIPQTSPAENFRLKLADEIAGFEATLDPDEEVGIRMSDGNYWLTEISLQPPEHVVFMAMTVAGERLRVFRHYTSAEVVLIALRKRQPDAPAHRIGFRFGEQDEPTS